MNWMFFRKIHVIISYFFIFVIIVNCSFCGQIFWNNELEKIFKEIENQKWDDDRSIYEYKKYMDFLNNHIQKMRQKLLEHFCQQLENRDVLIDEGGEKYGENLLDEAEMLMSDKSGNKELVIPVIKSMNYIGGKHVTDFLAQYGESIIDQLLDSFHDEETTDGCQAGIISTIGTMLSANRIESRIQDITDFLLDALKIENYSIRNRAIDAVTHLKNPVVIPYLEEITKSDPHSIKRVIDEGQPIVFPLRVKAKKAIEKIKQSMN